MQHRRSSRFEEIMFGFKIRIISAKYFEQKYTIRIYATFALNCLAL